MQPAPARRQLAGSAGAPNGLELRVDDDRYLLVQNDSRSIQKWLAGLPAQTMMIDLVTNQESTVQDWLALAASNTADQNDLLEVIFLRPSSVTEIH